MAYLLDSNILIAPSRQLPIDIFPSLWGGFEELLTNGNMLLIDKVKEEIENGGDELSEWCKLHLPKSSIVSTETEAVILEYRKIFVWAQTHGQYTPIAKKEFLSNTVADAFLVAVAKAYGHTIVTFEKSEPNIKRRIKIPEVCEAMDVRFCDHLAALRSLKWRF
ncbi:MAG: DUF4411 family protein [Bacteroidales bacterium]|nr:DUF4411 family protein [Bacteroidales bacterium]